MTPEEFADPSTLRRAFEEFADRVNGLGGLLWQSDVDSNDAMTGGQVLRYMADGLEHSTRDAIEALYKTKKKYKLFLCTISQMHFRY